MSESYREMWSQLGLDLQAHDALLEVLGPAYANLFMSQPQRPQSLAYFDFVMSEVHGLRVKELMDARVQGRKVVGSYCVFVPEELVLAVQGIAVGLCSGADFATDQVEALLPRNTCALIKSVFGFKLGKICPYVEASDLIVGENTCDGKKKAYEQLRGLVKNLYVMDLPQMKSEAGKSLLREEYLQFKQELEKLTGNPVTVASLQQGIKIANDKRRAMQRLNSLRQAAPAPISGLDALLANQLFFFDDPVRFTQSVHKICDELEDRVHSRRGCFPAGTPRVIVSGCPMAIPNWKVPAIVEKSGAVIVGEESCVGERGARWLTAEAGGSVEELINNLVERYFQIDCAIFTPNPSRLEHLREMAVTYHAQGIIHYSLQFCQPYQMEGMTVRKELEKAGVPVLTLETDYSQEDVGQIKTRVEAFVEMLKSRPVSA